MNQRVQYLIQNPFEAGIDDVSVLQSELEKYPYFSNLRNLLVFTMKEYGHSSFDSELRKTSIYSPSRVALYHYLQKERLENQQEEKESEVLTFQPEETVQEAFQQTEASEKLNQTDLSENETVSEEDLVETNDSGQAEISENETESESATEAQTKLKEEMTFSEWLSVKKKQSEASENEQTEKDIKFKLIDEFIEKAPKIQTLDKSKTIETDTPVRNLSTEYSDLMTETLAQIYVNQKKYEKAIRAYKILSIKYPDKKKIFLDKISEIENLTKS